MSTLADHPFLESANPRTASSCARCGKLRWSHPEPVPEVERCPDWEREVTSACADGLIDSAPLSAYADERAHDAPLRDFATRDFDQEVREELADARNYICWAIQRDEQFADSSDETDLRRQLRSQALGQIAIAFHLIEQARQL